MKSLTLSQSRTITCLMIVFAFLCYSPTANAISKPKEINESTGLEAIGESEKPIALVYRGPAGCKGCSEPVAKMLRTSPQEFLVKYVGPKEKLPLEPSSFKNVVLYVQPGGKDNTRKAYRQLGEQGQETIIKYVKNGGNYLGICQGAYLAGTKYGGLGLLAPGNIGWYIGSKGASTSTPKSTLIPIFWGTKKVNMYFQNGPYIIPSQVAGEKILARYSNGLVAALVKPYGEGKVGVIGTHPEATAYWYWWAGLEPYQDNRKMGYRLIDQLLR